MPGMEFTRATGSTHAVPMSAMRHTRSDPVIFVHVAPASTDCSSRHHTRGTGAAVGMADFWTRTRADRMRRAVLGAVMDACVIIGSAPPLSAMTANAPTLATAPDDASVLYSAF